MTKKYDSYKPSGVKWLGEIPSHWNVVKLLNISNKVDYRGKTPTKTDEGIFLVTARNIKNGKINYSLSQEYISKDDFDNVMSRGKVNIGDILFTTEAPLGEIALVDKEDIALAQRIIKFRFENNITDSSYIKYLMESHVFQNQIYSQATGSTALGLKGSKLNSLKVFSFDIREQTAIANYLDEKTASIDGSIETLKGKKELLIEQKKAIIHKAVTQGLDDSVPMKDSGVEWIGVVPEHWNVNRLKTFINVLSSGIDYFNGEKSYLTTKSIGENGIKEIDSSITINDKPSRANMQPRLNSIWIAYMKDTNKMLLVNNTDIVDKYIISTGMFGFIPKNKNISKYFSYLVKGMNFIGQKHMLATGTTQVSVNDGDFKSIYISLPNNEKEQQQIVDFLDKKTSKIDEAIEEVDKQIKLLEEYKKTLINDVVTGKRRVYEGEI